MSPAPAGRAVPPVVSLIGFMGAGKTAVGRALARLLDLDLVDTDEIVAGDAGRPIPEIFASEGEEGFRAREAAAVARAVRGHGRVIALGGGAVLSEGNRAAIRAAGPAVYLRARPETLLVRVGGGAGRPLLADDPTQQRTAQRVTAQRVTAQRVTALLGEREEIYRAAADLIVDTDDRTPREIAREIASRLGLEPGSRGDEETP